MTVCDICGIELLAEDAYVFCSDFHFDGYCMEVEDATILCEYCHMVGYLLEELYFARKAIR